jgi:hypothetical protein
MNFDHQEIIELLFEPLMELLEMYKQGTWKGDKQHLIEELEYYYKELKYAQKNKLDRELERYKRLDDLTNAAQDLQTELNKIITETENLIKTLKNS